MAASHTILCIDDEELGLRIRKMLLESEGFRVLTSTNGQQGLEIFRSNPINAVVLDYSMPKINGAIVAAEIKRLRSHIPIILLTAHPTAPDDVKANIDAFVEKGQSPILLLNALMRALQMPVHAHPELAGKFVVFVDADRRYVEVTDGVCELLGYSRSELLGKTIDEITAPEIREQVPRLFHRYRERGHLEGEFVLRRRDGTRLVIHYVSTVLPDGCMAARWEPLAA